MTAEYSVETCRTLAARFREAGLSRPMRIGRYDPSDELVYDVTGVAPARPARVRLAVQRFVGGGFAGQVYQVRLVDVDAPDGPIEGLAVGGLYAVKILIPPSGGAKVFRDAIYRAGFQGPFQLQCNPDAARAGALWQKLIRRAAAVRFGDERAVVDVLATFVDERLGSCGEISEWVDGRTWRFEVDDHLDARKKWVRGEDVPAEDLGSPEYRAKREFMGQFVRLLHDVGAPELARQYEWWTCKSQPNALKRLDTEDSPAAGLTAVDFRAGLALLPILPMSPADVPLIFKGVARGSLVQFDRGEVGKLRAFTEAHPNAFAHLQDALTELESADRAYRDALPDVTHHHVRLLNPRRWGKIIAAAVTGWRVRNVIDERRAEGLRASLPARAGFYLLGTLPAGGVLAALAVLIWALFAWRWSWTIGLTAAGLGIVLPAAGRFCRAMLGRSDLRRHVGRMLASPRYLLRALRGRNLERLIAWHRAGRVTSERAEKLSRQQWRIPGHLPLSVLPVGLHRLLTDRRYAAGALAYVFVRPVRLMFNPAAREQWLREMIREGVAKGMLTELEADGIVGRIKEPFIQKYLKALAVHVCTLPVTQVVSVAVAVWYKVANNLTWGEAWKEMAAILIIFQVVPISPGSLTRGLYVVWRVIRDRNVRDYNIAVFLGFFKYIGYLAFPIQMAYRYPALARFMAAHWATDAVHVVPVFGEHGALLEHGVFDAFYNHPLTIRRRMRRRAERRIGVPARYWHAPVVALAAAAVFALADVYRIWAHAPPTLVNVWYLAILVPLLSGVLLSSGAGGAKLSRRVLLGVGCGAAVGVIYGFANVLLRRMSLFTNAALLPGGWSVLGEPVFWRDFAHAGAWGVFLFAIFTVLGVLLAETRPVDQ